MTDIRAKIAALIDATIAGQDTKDLASHVVQAKTVEALKPTPPPTAVRESLGDASTDYRSAFVNYFSQDPQYFGGGDATTQEEIGREFDALVDQGEIPEWLEDMFINSGKYNDDEGIVFGAGSSFVEYLNTCVEGLGTWLLSTWDQDAGYETGGSVDHMPDDNGDAVDPSTGAPTW